MLASLALLPQPGATSSPFSTRRAPSCPHPPPALCLAAPSRTEGPGLGPAPPWAFRGPLALSLSLSVAHLLCPDMGARPWSGRGSAPLMRVPDPHHHPQAGSLGTWPHVTSRSWGFPPYLELGQETSHSPEAPGTPRRGSEHPEDGQTERQTDRQKNQGCLLWGRHPPATPNTNVPEKEPTPQGEPGESPQAVPRQPGPGPVGEAWTPSPLPAPQTGIAPAWLPPSGAHPLVHPGLTLPSNPPL